MGKYDGINVAAVTLIDNHRRNAVTPAAGAWRWRLVRFAVAGLVTVAAFIGTWTGLPVFTSVSDAVTGAVCYDFEWVSGGGEPGDGAISAYLSSEKSDAA